MSGRPARGVGRGSGLSLIDFVSEQTGKHARSPASMPDRHPPRRATHITAPAKRAKTPATRKITSRVVPGTKNEMASNTTPTAMLMAGLRFDMLAW